MKILMAVDDSKFAEDRLRAIVTRGRPESTEVMVLHILQPIAPPPPQMDRNFAPELEGEKVAARAGRPYCGGVAPRWIQGPDPSRGRRRA